MRKSGVWPKGNVQFYRQARLLSSVVRTGRLVAVDPATGSTSQPGWAVFEAGEYVASGVLALPKRAKIQERLKALETQLLALKISLQHADILVVEKLRGRMVHAYLHWSTGVIVSTLEPKLVVECPIQVWKAATGADFNYTKGDEADAIKFGEAMVRLARGMGPADPLVDATRRKRSKRGRPTTTSGVRATSNSNGRVPRTKHKRGAK